MKITDRVYGDCVIEEEVLIELIESEAIGRLGKINQYGAIYQIYPQFFTTRKEHSIGVMLLLSKLGASLEEQIAGLIHDVPHTAFSHVIDYVFGDKKMETSYHEIIQKDVLNKSDIPEILKNYGINPDKIFEIHNFGILERDLPDLCADRFDYLLRDLLTYDMLNAEEIKQILDNTIVYNGEIILKDMDAALLIARKFIEGNKKIWSSPYQIFIARKLADTIKIALEKGYIDMTDLHGTDNKLYRKLNSIEDKEIKNNLDLMTKKIVVERDDKNYELKVYTKLRMIDPKVLVNNKLERLSDLDKSFQKMKDNYAKEHSKGYALRMRERKEGEIIIN